MSNIRSIDMLFLDDVFDMGSGHVLNFSDRTFAQFCVEELNIIPTTRSTLATGLEGEALAQLQTVEKATVVRTLHALWEYREALRQRSGEADKVHNAHGRLLSLINQLEDRPGSRALSGSHRTR